MAKPTGGLLAFNARGSIAKTIVYASWRGRQYVRQHVIPANPRSTGQTNTRNAFSFLSDLWKVLPSAIQASWTLAAKGLPVTDRNLFVKANLSNIVFPNPVSFTLLETSAKGGLPASSVVVTPGAGELSIAIDPGTPPTGWSVVECSAAAFDGSGIVSNPVPPIFYGTDPSTPYTVVLTGLTAATVYTVNAWVHWMKPDGTPAYGPPTVSTGTPT